MSRAKGWIWITLALVCALSAGGLTYYLLQRQSAATQRAVSEAAATAQVAPIVETVSLPVAARDLERGAILTADDIVTKDYPKDLVPPAAIADAEQLNGKILIEPLIAGEIFRESALLGGTGTALSAQIEPGKTVIAFPVVDLFSGTGLFVAGDRVDLLLTRAGTAPAADVPGDNGTITGYSVQNVRVLRVLSAPPTDSNANPAPTALLLELSPEDAVMVKRVKDGGGLIDLALRSPADNEVFDVDSVTDRDLLRLMNGVSNQDAVGNTP